MANSDVTLSVDLDTKDALQTAKELGKEVEKSINSQIGKEASVQMSSFNSQLKQTTIEASRLGERLNEISNKRVPTEDYNKLNSQMETLEKTAGKVYEKMNVSPAAQQMDALQTQKDLLEEQYVNYGKIFGEGSLEQNVVSRDLQQINTEIAELQSSKDWKTYSSLEAELEKIQAEITEINRKKQEMEASGRAFVDTKSTEEYKKLETQLDKVNDKTKLLLIRKKELAQKEAGVSAGGDGGSFTGASFVAMATGANKTLTIVKSLTKVLKRGLLTLAAITLGVRGLMGIVNKLRSMIKEGFKAIYEGDEKFKKQVDDLKKSWAEVKANLAAAFMPIIEIAIPYIQKLLDWINLLLNKIAMFVAAIAGQNAYTKAIKKTGDAAKGASKQLSKFDELNNLSSGGGAGGSEWDMQKLPIDNKILEAAERLKAILNEIKEKFKELVATPFMEGFNAAVGDLQGKIDVIKENIKGIGTALIQVFTDPEVQKASENYTKAVFKFLGAGTGLAVNAGVNVAEAFTGGIDKFLTDNQDTIKTDVATMFDMDTENLEKGSDILIAISKIIDQIGESESLVSAISHSLMTIWNLFVTAKESASEFMGIILDTFGPAITQNIQKFKDALEAYFSNWDENFALYESMSKTLKDTVIGLLEAIRPVFEEIGQIVADLVGYLLDVWTTWISPILSEVGVALTEMWVEYIDPIMQDIVSIVQEVVTLITPLLKKLWEDVLKPTLDWLIPTLGQILVPLISSVWQLVVYVLKNFLNIFKFVFDLIKEVVGFVVAVLKGDVPGAIEHLKGVVGVVIEFISNSLKILFDFFSKGIANNITLITGLVNFIRGVVTTVGLILGTMLTTVGQVFENIYTTITEFIFNGKEAFRGFWTDVGNIAVNALNSLIGSIEDGLNKILGALDRTGISDFVGDRLHINVPTSVSLDRIKNIPPLAQGTVIPPSMGEFIARLGDNNRETEVVSPLSTMKEALMAALQEAGGTGEYHIHVDLDGREIAKAVVKQNEIYKKSTGGRTMFA